MFITVPRIIRTSLLLLASSVAIFSARADQPPEIYGPTFPQTTIFVNPVTNSETFATACVADAAGNTYMTGSFQGTTTFGTNVLNSSGGFAFDDVYLVKYDLAGKVLWARRAGGSGKDFGRALTLDGAGGVYLTGTSDSQPFTIGTNVINYIDKGMFVARYDANGNVLWVRRSTSASIFSQAVMTINGTARDAANNLIIAGSFRNSPVISDLTTSITLTNKTPAPLASAYDDMFLAKYDLNGNLQWAINPGSTNSEVASAVAVDSTGAIYVAGGYQEVTTLGTQTYTNLVEGILLAKFSSAGTLLWDSNLSDATNSNPGKSFSIVVDAADRVTMSFQGDNSSKPFAYRGTNYSLSFGNINLLAQFDTGGNLIWLKQSSFIGGNPSTLALDQQNNIYLGCNAGISGGSVASLSLGIVKHNSAGVSLWTNSVTKTPITLGQPWLSVDPAGITHVANTLTGGENTVLTVGWTNIYPFTSFGNNALLFLMASNFVSVPPVFVQQPTNMVFQPPKGLTNAAQARAWPAPRYYWVMNTNKLTAQTNYTLALGPTGFTNQTSYFVIASNAFGMATSTVVTASAGIYFVTAPPTNINVLIGTTLALSGVGAGTTPVSYQWKFNVTNFVGGNSGPLALPGIATNQAGNYTLILSNATGTLTSTPPSVVNVVFPGFIDPSFTNYYSGGLDLLRMRDGGYYVARSAVYHINSSSAVDGSGPWTGSGGVGTQVLLRESDTQLLLGGTFAGGVSRVFTNGTVDATFSTGIGPVNAPEGPSFTFIESLIRLSNGKYLVGGRFTSFSGVAVTNLVRLNTNGSVDLTFMRHVMYYSTTPSQGPGGIHKLALQSDGKILVGGEIALVDGLSVSNLFRLNPDGTFDNSFAASPILKVPPFGRVQTILPLADGKMFIGGAWGNPTNSGVVRLGTNGLLDGAYVGPASTAPTYAITLLQSNQLMIGGQNFLRRVSYDGLSDPIFNANTTIFNSSQTYAMVLEPTGNLVIAGTYGIKRLWLEPVPVVVPTFSSGSGVAVVNGQMQFSACGGVEGQTVYVQASMDLASWQTVSTNIVTGGCINYIDPQLPAPPNRYYRLTTTP